MHMNTDNACWETVPTETGPIEITIFIMGAFTKIDQELREDYGLGEEMKTSDIPQFIFSEIVEWYRFAGTWPGVGDEVYHIAATALFTIIHRTFSSEPRGLTYWVQEREADRPLI